MPIQSATESNWIAFPNLDWKFNLDDSIDLFGLNIKFYGLLIAIGFSLAILYGVKRAKHFDIDPDRMIDVALIVTPLAFIGARLYYVFFSGDPSYFENPLTILMVWKGGLGIYGGVITAFGVGILACKLRKVNLWAMFDVTALGFLIGQCIGRWGNFFNQEAFGGNTNLPWAMTGDVIQSGVNGAGYDPALPVHPTFLYESLWNAVGFVALHFLSKKRQYDGQMALGYVAWYGLGRTFIEGLRMDSLYWGSFRVSQVLAAATCFVAVAILLFMAFRKHDRAKLYSNVMAETLAAEAAAKAEKKTCPCKKAAEEAPIEEAPAEEEKQETTEE